MPRLAAVLVCSLSIAGAAACGQNEEEQDAARRTVERFNAALADKDGATVCRVLSRAAQRELERAAQRRQSCASLFDFALAFSSGLDRTAGAKVKEVDVDGNEATAKVETRRGEVDVPLVKEDGRWKLRGLGVR